MNSVAINIEPLLEGKKLEDEDVICVFVLPNIFQEADDGVCKVLQDTLDLEYCEHTFYSTFKIIEKPDEPDNQGNLTKQESDANLQNFWLMDIINGLKKEFGETKKVPFINFHKTLFIPALKIMQDDLKLELKLFFSQDKEEIFLTIKCSEENLRVQADLMDYKVELISEETSETQSYRSVAPYGEFQLRNTLGENMLQKHIYKQYDKAGNYVKTEQDRDELSYFTYKDKARILASMINSAIDMGELTENKVIAQVYGVHDRNIEPLKKYWGNFLYFWKPQDFSKIRMYYGEKISMYFAWLDYYVKWLIFPSIIGLITFFIRLDDYLKPDNPESSESMSKSQISIVLFSFILAVGSTIFSQVWIRRQNELCWMWGTTDLHEIETQRPSFKGRYGKDAISGQKKKIPSGRKITLVKRSFGLSVALLFVFLAIAAIFSILSFQQSMKIGHFRLGPLINALQIKIMNFVYRIVARKLNDWENYEFDSEYYDSLALKLYLFQFINCYSSLFYIAFIESYLGICEVGFGCLHKLNRQLGTIFIVSIVLNIFELGVPYLKSYLKKRSDAKAIEKLKIKNHAVGIEMTSYEEQSKLEEYETPLDDYMELIIDYGYVVMFSSAFPIVPFLAFILNLFEIRVDAFKLVHLSKRPLPAPANSIGVWMSIIRTVSVFGALTNTGLIIFTTDVFSLTDPTKRWLYFVIIEHVLLIFKIILTQIIPEMPTKVKRGLIWSNRMAMKKIFNKVIDVDEQRMINHLEFKGEIKKRAIFDPRHID